MTPITYKEKDLMDMAETTCRLRLMEWLTKNHIVFTVNCKGHIVTTESAVTRGLIGTEPETDIIENV